MNVDDGMFGTDEEQKESIWMYLNIKNWNSLLGMTFTALTGQKKMEELLTNAFQLFFTMFLLILYQIVYKFTVSSTDTVRPSWSIQKFRIYLHFCFTSFHATSTNVNIQRILIHSLFLFKN